MLDEKDQIVNAVDLLKLPHLQKAIIVSALCNNAHAKIDPDTHAVTPIGDPTGASPLSPHLTALSFALTLTRIFSLTPEFMNLIQEIMTLFEFIFCIMFWSQSLRSWWRHTDLV